VYNKKTKEYKLVCEVCGRDIEKSAGGKLNRASELWEEEIWEYALRVRPTKDEMIL
jgi:ribosomal protein S27E